MPATAATQDPEIVAIEAIIRALEQLDGNARIRVIAAALCIFDRDTAAARRAIAEFRKLRLG